MIKDHDELRASQSAQRPPRRSKKRWYQTKAFWLFAVQIAKLLVDVVRWFE
ncbi:MAG: hypothetical protein J0J01_07050 [Reyranella sp.]|uniref:hypothetical protein n=1 Tax=Reyranella sp. TaxID=1929291 RepID=UPI001AC8E0E6|nr:hypothetical protein [Reyranella sp.]MBN9086648.1 hypothetical protein [Reyranella sp.]